MIIIPVERFRLHVFPSVGAHYAPISNPEQKNRLLFTTLRKKYNDKWYACHISRIFYMTSMHTASRELTDFVADVYDFIICGVISEQNLQMVNDHTGEKLFQLDENQEEEITRLQKIR